MKYKLNEYNIWEFGQRKDADGNPHQEDSIYPSYGKANKEDRLFILCDGMGGHAAGEVASATVCEVMSESILSQQPDAEGDFTDGMLQNALADAYDALDKKDSGSELKKMGTTLTFLKLHSKGATVAHMGDSRVYHIRPGKTAKDTKILFCTKDHSLINDLIRVGEMTEEEAKHSDKKNVITRAMQPHTKPRMKAEINHIVDIKPGDYFYLCSDGMLEQMSDENLRFNFSDTTGNAENKVKILVQATSLNRDNHSAIIVHITDVIDPMPIPETVSIPQPVIAKIDNVTPSLTTRPNGELRGTSIPKMQSEKPKSGIWVAIIVIVIAILGFVAYVALTADDKKNEEKELEEKIDDVIDAAQDDHRYDRYDNERIENRNERKIVPEKKPEVKMPVERLKPLPLKDVLKKQSSSGVKPDSKQEPNQKPDPGAAGGQEKNVVPVSKESVKEDNIIK